VAPNLVALLVQKEVPEVVAVTEEDLDAKTQAPNTLSRSILFG